MPHLHFHLPRFWFLFLLATSLCSLGLGAGPHPQPRSVHIESLQALVDFLESEADTAINLSKHQSASAAEVDFTLAQLAKARHDLALAKNDRDELLAQCGQLVEIRDRQFKRQAELSERGFGSTLKLSVAKRRLACSRYQLASLNHQPAEALDHHQQIVRLCGDELSHLAKLQADGAVSVMELNRARHRETIAKHHLGILQGDSQTMLPGLRDSVEVFDQELQTIRRLRGLGYADLLDEHFAHKSLLNAKLLMASLEKDHAVAKRKLDQLIQIHHRILPQLGGDRTDRVARLLIERELSFDRWRKAGYERDGRLVDDLSLSILDY